MAAELGATKYSIGVEWVGVNDPLLTESKTYAGINFSSDAASVRAAEANEFVTDLGRIAAVSYFRQGTVKIIATNQLEVE